MEQTPIQTLLWQSIHGNAGSQSDAPCTIDDLSLLNLSLVYGKTLAPALKIAEDPNSIVQLCSHPSGRSCMRVKSSSSSEPYYTVFLTSSYCTCPAFLHEVAIKGESLACKHILAVLLRGGAKGAREIGISDLDLASYLQLHT
jgi:hypothetical protein